MKVRLQVSGVVIVAFLLFFSCARPSFTLMGTHAAVSRVSHYDTEGSLISRYESLSIFIESEEDAILQMEVTSPDRLNTWLFPAKKKIVADQGYYGKAGLSLGQRLPLPRGEWELRILKDDGRTITEPFMLEKGSEAQTYQHLLDGVEGNLVLDESVKECSIQILDENRAPLYSTLTTEQTISLGSLYPKWEKARFVVLSWYDEPSKLSHIAWYEL